MVSNSIDVPLIVGGGIKSSKQAQNAASAGADVIVTGNVVESKGYFDKVSKIIKSIKEYRK
jgi:heptaprenylglyceryl phosphate synthase